MLPDARKSPIRKAGRLFVSIFSVINLRVLSPLKYLYLLSIFSVSDNNSTEYVQDPVLLVFSVILSTDLFLTTDKISSLKREKAILALNNEANLSEADYKFMLGDFNCSVSSSIHQYLLL